MGYFMEGKKIYLRELKKSDIPVWHTWFNDPEITDSLNKGIFPNTEAAQEEYFNQLLKSKTDVQLAIVVKKNNTLVGIIGMHKIDWVSRNGDISIVIGDKSYWGKGIAQEAISLIAKHAFMKMNLNKLTAGMNALNAGSKKCFENNGFVLEGTLRKHFFYKGKYINVYRLGLLKEEWEKKAEVSK